MIWELFFLNLEISSSDGNVGALRLYGSKREIFDFDIPL